MSSVILAILIVFEGCLSYFILSYVICYVIPVILTQPDTAVRLSEIQFVLEMARIVVGESHVNILAGCFIVTKMIE